MARKARNTPKGYVYHVLNRSAGRFAMLRREGDFVAFERVMMEAWERVPLRILSWCLMRNHWHFVVWPRTDMEVTEFFRWLTHTHAMRWRVSHGTVGYGHLYQGRFKSFPVQQEGGVARVCRYVERNPVAAGVVKRAEEYRWGSLWARENGGAEMGRLVGEWPLRRPGNWVELVNTPLSNKEREKLRRSVDRGQPYGDAAWMQETVLGLGLEHTVRGEGRPKKRDKN